MAHEAISAVAPPTTSDPAQAAALAEIERLEGLIQEALTPAPCGDDPLRAMGRVGNHLDQLKYEYLYRSDWPMNGDVDGLSLIFSAC